MDIVRKIIYYQGSDDVENGCCQVLGLDQRAWEHDASRIQVNFAGDEEQGFLLYCKHTSYVTIPIVQNAWKTSLPTVCDHCSDEP